MKGSYVLVMKLDTGRTIGIGARGDIEFPDGYYAYCGSALNSLEARVARHLRAEKKIHWHVDYLLQYARIESVFVVKSPRRLECTTANDLSRTFPPVPGFGCSDCRCGSHLFHHHGREALERRLEDMGYKRYNE